MFTVHDDYIHPGDSVHAQAHAHLTSVSSPSLAASISWCPSHFWKIYLFPPCEGTATVRGCQLWESVILYSQTPALWDIDFLLFLQTTTVNGIFVFTAFSQEGKSFWNLSIFSKWQLNIICGYRIVFHGDFQNRQETHPGIK